MGSSTTPLSDVDAGGWPWKRSTCAPSTPFFRLKRWRTRRFTWSRMTRVSEPGSMALRK
jgi:hypothetical protein